MELQEIMNSPGLWIASAFMVVAVVGQAIIFLRTSLKEAKTIGLSREQYTAGMRSSIITAIGPSFSPVIILLSMIAVVGAPTTWMRLCDVGAGRTELAIVSLASQAVGAEPGTSSFGVEAFSYSIWGMALNNLGWLLVVLITTHNMSKIVDKLYTKYNPKWIKLLMGGTIIGLFAYLLSNQLAPGLLSGSWASIVAALVSGAAMLLITKVFAKHQRLQELGLGLSMLAGMFVTQIIFG